VDRLQGLLGRPRAAPSGRPDLQVTTVAFDGNTLAADTLITSDWKSAGHSKFHMFRDGSVGAFAGVWGKVQEAIKFLEGDADSAPPEDWDAIVMRPDGTAWAIDADGCSLDITGKHYAIGSGAQFALGAMACDRAAPDAVRVSIGLDPFSGGEVECVSVSDVRPKPRRRGKTTKKSRS
jgi:hypothetical protein